MAVLGKDDISAALLRLGELAASQGLAVDLLIVGGAVMVLEFEARLSTRDVDAIIIGPAEASQVRAIAAVVARERGWTDDWLNDAAKGFLVGSSAHHLLLSNSGIRVSRPAIAQLLAMKLCAWRDDVDIADASRLLSALQGNRDEVWSQIEPHLQRGRELTARYAFDDLWEARA
jgi:hypothetical protein